MKLRNKDMQYYINEYVKATQSLSQDINILVLYKIRKNFSRIEDALKPYCSLLKEIVTKNKNTEDMKQDIAELDEQEVDVDIEKISIADFGDIKTSSAFINSIFFMLED